MRFVNTVTSPLRTQGIRRDGKRQRVVPVLLLCGSLAACGAIDKPAGVVGNVQGFGGMVAADEPHAVLIGREVLSAGGSPADAAVAMAFTLSVTYPAEVSLGSGGACLVYDRAKNTVESLDFLPAPSSQPANDAGVATMVPALPRGLYALYAKYGRLHWEELLAPAERAARQSSTVSRALATRLAPAAGTLANDAEAAQIFLKFDGTTPGEGESLSQFELGASLARLRTQGVGEFYTGEWSREIVASVTAAGGTLNAEELKNFLPRWSAPLAVPFGDDTAYFVSSAASAGQGEAAQWKTLAGDGRYAEAGAAQRPSLIATAFRNVAEPGREIAGDAAHPASDTTSGTGLVVIDQDGSAVSCALGLNHTFGVGRVAPNTGILLAAVNAGPSALGPMLVVNENSNEFRYATAAGGGVTAPAALTEAALAALIDHRSLGDAVRTAESSARVNAIRCESGSPDPSRCSVATDPRGAGLAMTVGAD